MKKYSLLFFVSLILIPFTTVIASEEGFYAGLSGGFAYLSDASNSLSTPVETEYKGGHFEAIKAGYRSDFGFRAEAELSNRSNDIKKVSTSTSSSDSNGDVDVLALMANVYYDFDTEYSLTPYLGLGAGACRISISNSTTGILIADDDTFEFSYQVMAGISYPIFDHVDANLEYRYFATTDPSFKDNTGAAFTSEVSHNIISLGISYYF